MARQPERSVAKAGAPTRKDAAATTGGDFLPSFLAARTVAGELVFLAADAESADPAMAMRDLLRKSKGADPRDAFGTLLYTDVLPVIRGKTTRRLRFGKG